MTTSEAAPRPADRADAARDPRSGRPVTVVDTWLGGGEVLATLHVPDGAATTGVVICPPIGYEYTVAYRTLRHLADRLAEQGLAAARYDHPGFGDSTHDVTAESLSRGAAVAAEALRDAGCASIAYVGLGSGALVASLAAASDPAPAALVLWDPAASGRQWLRRQRSIYQIEVGPLAEPAPEDTVEIAGAELPDWLAEQIAALDYDPLVATSLPTLVAVRSGAAGTLPKTLRPVADRLDVVEVPGHENALDVSSIESTIPAASVDVVSAWLAERVGGGAGARVAAPAPVVTARAAFDGAEYEESLRRLGPHSLFAVETRPAGGADDLPIVVLHNGSAEHRIGTTRYQVELARRFAAFGIRSLRVDRRGTGESAPVVADEPNLLFTQEWLDDGADVLDALDLPREKVGVVGMCVGSWVGLVAAPSRVAFVAALAVNDHRVVPQAPQAPHEGVDPVEGAQEPTPALRDRLVAVAKRRLPYPLLLALASRGVVQFAEPNLRRALAAGTDVVVLLSPSDAEIFRAHRGPHAVSRLQRTPGRLTVLEHPAGDHALYSPGIRRRAVDEAFAAAVRAFRIAR
ncbi:serine aminopeptidase domain-containing protein [Frondihabitans australicus]|uniref:Serine aminopeptidase S33 family n=1 Tax=Frondihabitans australicus TaxID=386892 RepID=A0A495IK58_9MICO|nr:alpha/beta hydrolase [Frondihabitans australicus]RKR76392.1 serine aminopeptidase S33 family [Frondihabitans australicus]